MWNKFIVLFVVLIQVSSLDSQLSRADSAMYFGVQAYKSKDIANAKIYLEECIKLNPLNDECLFYRGQIAYDMQDFELGKQLFKGTIARAERDPSSWNMLGLCFQELKQYDSAEFCFKNCVKINSKNADYFANWGKNEYLQQRYEHAEELFSTAILLNNSKSSFYKHRAEVFKKMGRKEDAIVDLKDALKMSPEDQSITSSLNAMDTGMSNNFIIFGLSFVAILIGLYIWRVKKQSNSS